MEKVNNQAISDDPLLACCLCKRLLNDAVHLTCLHNCCRQCFSTAALAGNSQDVACGTCETVTQAGRQQPNWFIDGQVNRHRLVAESRFCGKCQENGKHDRPAVVWCVKCQHSLCEGCAPLHREYFKQHVTQLLDELRSVTDMIPQKSLTACPIHQMPMDIACCNCEQTKCIICWAECNEKKHEMHIVGKDSFDNYIDELVACISTVEREVLQKLEVLEKPKEIRIRMEAALDRHLEDLKTRKRRIVDVVEIVYQELEVATKNAYDNLYAKCDAAAAAANRIGFDVSDAQAYIHRLVESYDKCEILMQQKMVRERLSVLSAQLDTLNNHLTESMGDVKVEASLPNDLEEVIRAWIGMPLVCSASSSYSSQLLQQEQQQQHSFSFGVTSVGIEIPVECKDVALTKDGRSLLLAAGKYGLLEFCSSSGRELSYWIPPEKRDGKENEVSVVAPLSKGHAAVALCDETLVVLLRQGEQIGGGSDGLPAAAAAAAAGDAWTEERRVVLPWVARCLSGHGDVLAVSDSSSRLRLISSSSGRRLSIELYCNSSINSVAVAARLFVTAHGDAMNREHYGSGFYQDSTDHLCVLDARSIPYGQRLRRHELSGSEERMMLLSIYSESSGSYLYAALSRRDWSQGRVSVLTLAEGSELRRVALSFDLAASSQPLLLPARLSLSDDRAVAAEQKSGSRASSCDRALLLAALCSDPTTSVRKTVMVHRRTLGIA